MQNIIIIVNLNVINKFMDIDTSKIYINGTSLNTSEELPKTSFKYEPMKMTKE